MSRAPYEVGSSCSDLHEINDAKVDHILSYLDEAINQQKQASLWRHGAAHDPGAAGASMSPAPSGDGYAVRASGGRSVTPLSPFDGGDRGPGSTVSGGGSLLPAGGGATINGVGAGGAYQAVYHGIKSRIETMRFANDGLQRENETLKRQLATFEDRKSAELTKARADADQEAGKLRHELEQTTRRFTQLTDKLKKDNSDLTQTVEAVTRQLRAELAGREEERRKLESGHAAAISTLKTKWQAQEKAAREKWKIAEAKRIKESTLQSLEPDIVLLLNRHKSEKARMREEFETELRQRDEVIAAKEATVEEVKVRLRREAEAAIQREQQSFRDRLDDETARVRKQLEDERRLEKQKRDDMEGFFEGEKVALQRELKRLEQEVFSLRGDSNRQQASFHDAVAEEVARITGQSNQLVSDLKEKLLLEFTLREKEAKEQNERYLASKEEEIRSRCAAERDAEIAQAAQRMEAEHIKALTTSQGNDSLLRERYSQLSGENERLRVELELTREQVRVSMQQNTQREQETSQLREAAHFTEQRVKEATDRVRAEMEQQVMLLDHTWKTKLSQMEDKHVDEMFKAQRELEKATRDLEHAKASSAEELRVLEQQHHSQLNNISERMLVALTHKDNTIKAQEDQLVALQEAVQIRDQQLQRHQALLE